MWSSSSTFSWGHSQHNETARGGTERLMSTHFPRENDAHRDAVVRTRMDRANFKAGGQVVVSHSLSHAWTLSESEA